jgi:cyclopropane-fatty-acyl-phospholipid synthase
MNHELSFDENLPVAPATSGGFYQAIIFRALAPMTRGFLEIEFPDGTRKTFGDPSADIRARIRLRRERFFQRCVLFGDIGFGESYVDGDWETESIEQVIAWFILNQENSPSQSGAQAKHAIVGLLRGWNRLQHMLRPNSVRTSRRNIAEHYDLGNDFYRSWLDATMTYSSALFSSAEQSLESAQIAKYDALCQKLRLRESDRVLEIGSGWGGFACHAVKRYGCRVTTVTISQAQFDFARERFEREGVADRVEIRLQDYRNIEGRFDKIASIEMMEALGDKYLETFLAKIDDLLAPDGLAGFQYITAPDSRHAELKRGVDWIQKHIFPGSLLLSVGRVNEALRRTGELFLHDLLDFGESYARTLRIWRDTFNRRLDSVRALGFDDRFIRKWNFYLSYCEAAFTMRNISVVQAIYTRPNNRRLAEKAAREPV